VHDQVGRVGQAGALDGFKVVQRVELSGGVGLDAQAG
jgi:hypothetical protein